MTIDLDKLEELMRAATPGPWEAGAFGWVEAMVGVAPLKLRRHALSASEADLIAASRNMLPDLIAEVRALRARVAELENQLEHMGNVALLSGGRGRVLFSEEIEE